MNRARNGPESAHLLNSIDSLDSHTEYMSIYYLLNLRYKLYLTKWTRHRYIWSILEGKKNFVARVASISLSCTGKGNCRGTLGNKAPLFSGHL